MNKTVRIFLCAAMVAALALIIVCGLHYRNLGNQLSIVQADLEKCETNWKNTNAEKLILLETLDAKTADVREAEISHRELIQKAEDLKKDIEELRQEIGTLKGIGN